MPAAPLAPTMIIMLLIMEKAHVLELKASASCIPQSYQNGWLFTAGETNVQSGLCLSRLPRGLFVINGQSTMSKSNKFYFALILKRIKN